MPERLSTVESSIERRSYLRETYPWTQLSFQLLSFLYFLIFILMRDLDSFLNFELSIRRDVSREQIRYRELFLYNFILERLFLLRILS